MAAIQLLLNMEMIQRDFSAAEIFEYVTPFIRLRQNVSSFISI